jgi:saccharopepsin
MGATLHPDGYYSIDCSARKHLPDIAFTLAGHNFSIGPEDYVLNDNDLCISAFFGVDYPPPGGPFAVLGPVFLRKWYSVFDVGAKTISFARAKR